MERFEDPLLLLLLLVVPLRIAWYVRRKRAKGALRFTRVETLRSATDRGRAWLRHLPFATRAVALALLVVALARPQSGVTDERVTTEGVDIVVALDISSSMLAEDLEPNRLEAAKGVARDFVEGRTNDRIGLVIFAGDAFTQAPLTLDHGVVSSLIDELEVGMVADGTALGMGLATAVKRLEASDASSRVVILLTDGRNNRGEIGPVTAAQMAEALDVRVYTIGAGSRGTARVPVDDPVLGRRYVRVQVDVDEPTLQEIAAATGGAFFRATDRTSLEEVWTRIDEMERTEIEVENFTRYGELFHLPLLAAGLLILLEVVLSNTVLRRLP